MSKEYLGVRINPEIKKKLELEAESRGKTITELTEQALSAYLNIDTDKSELAIIRERLDALETKFEHHEIVVAELEAYLSEDDKRYDGVVERLNALERIERPKKKQSREPKPVLNTDDLGELITKKEAVQLTGYSVNTLNRTFSQNGVAQVDKRGKEGLYSKQDVLEKIGIKAGYEH